MRVISVVWRRGRGMIEWVKVGDWILNTRDVSAISYEETPAGPKVEIFTTSGAEIPRSKKGGFSTVGDEARAVWQWWVARSQDVMTAVR